MSTPALWRALSLGRLLQWYVSASFNAFLHSQDIRAGLKRLRKIADIADNVFISLEREWYDRLVYRSVRIRREQSLDFLDIAYNEAKREPWVTLDNVAIVISAVVTLADDALIAFEKRVNLVHVCWT